MISLQKYSTLNETVIYPDHFSAFYNGKWLHGKKFSEEALKKAQQIVHVLSKHPDGTPMSDLEVLKHEPVFVSAASDNHVRELKKIMLKHVNETYLNSKQKVIVYDIDLR